MLPPVLKLRNHVMEYDWGSTNYLQDLLSDPRPVPMAELWMGAHPKAPSIVELSSGDKNLFDLINSEPELMLGSSGNELPFLFKVLSSVAPLSIQCHPDKKQAAEGFARENRKGIPFGAAERSYKDANAKPELICALTPFYALHGFRPVDETLKLWHEFGLHEVMNPQLAGKKDQKEIVRWLLELDYETISKLYNRVTDTLNRRYPPRVNEDDAIRQLPTKDTVDFWLIRLLELYPTDAGSLMPLLLQLHVLTPGQALFSEAGQLHSYLEGTGLEIMGNSDNVLRAGLTSKHKDPEELLRVLKFDTSPVHALTATGTGGGSVSEYPLPAESFVFGYAEVVDEVRLSGQGPIILLNLEHPLQLEHSELTFELERGASVYVRPGCRVSLKNNNPTPNRIYFAAATDIVEHI